MKIKRRREKKPTSLIVRSVGSKADEAEFILEPGYAVSSGQRGGLLSFLSNSFEKERIQYLLDAKDKAKFRAKFRKHKHLLCSLD